MAAAEKQNNCDVTIHTDFGMVWALSYQVSVGQYEQENTERRKSYFLSTSVI
jgi:hypothetical protein